MPLLTQERVAGGGQVFGDQGFHGTVDLGDHVVTVALGVNAQGLPGVEGEHGTSANRLQSLGEQSVEVIHVTRVCRWGWLRNGIVLWSRS